MIHKVNVEQSSWFENLKNSNLELANQQECQVLDLIKFHNENINNTE